MFDPVQVASRKTMCHTSGFGLQTDQERAYRGNIEAQLIDSDPRLFLSVIPSRRRLAHIMFGELGIRSHIEPHVTQVNVVIDRGIFRCINSK